MRGKIFNFLRKPVAVILSIVITATLISINGNIGYFFGLLIVLVFFWSSRFKGSEFGLNHPQWKPTILKAFLFSMLLFLLVDILIQPFIEIYIGAIDLSALDGIRGSFINYLVFILLMWVFAAFGEEFLYRGFFMRRLAIVLGDTNRTWLISAFLISIFFGMVHYYQGISGMITTGLIGLCLSLIYFKNRENLSLLILTHGIYDMIGITLVYFNKERVITDWIQGML